LEKRKFVYQFKVTLEGIQPPVWRRIQVPATYSFWDLHVAIQDSMGWQDCHLHAYRFPTPETDPSVEIGIPDDEPFADQRPCLPGWEIPIVALLQEPGTIFAYEYDFGDGWEHQILLEEILPRVPRQRYPKCLTGARACPPEDCGGTHGYEELIKIIRDPSHDEFERMKEWLGGGYDPEAFDPSSIRFDSPKKRWEIAFAHG